MKKLLLIPLIFLLSHCEVKVQDAHAQTPPCNQAWYCLGELANYSYFEKGGMQYMVIRANSFRVGGVYVINLTKEALEVEKLKLEIQKLKQP